MNKTVNINLANRLFHMDEEAYNKMRRYLESIKRSFANTPGSDEIQADIEARIAELFYEKLKDERQVITLKEVDDVISVMGQPEDYMIDEDIFEDEPINKSKAATGTTGRVKKLYRDMEHKYIGGVCSGLEHYLGLDALWIRIIFILLAVTTGFGFIAYILLWILVPEAVTTSQKLDMTGKPVNISNIERKVKEGIDDVADRVKSVDYEKVGNKVKSSGKTFFDTLGDIIMFLFKVFGKFIGILLILIGAATLIGLFIGLFTVGVLDMIHIPGVDFYNMVNSTNAPVWFVSLLAFFVVGIPFFFVLYLGLKILVNNLKSIGNIAKFSLLGLWLISLITLVVLGIRQAAAHAYSDSISVEQSIKFEVPNDTLLISMQPSEYFEKRRNMAIDGVMVTATDEGEEILVSDDVRLSLKKSKDSIVRVKIRKDANGSSFNEAKEIARNIEYSYTVEGNSIVFDDFLISAMQYKFRDQEVWITLYVPEGKTIQFDSESKRCIPISARNDQDMGRCDLSKHIWSMGTDGELKCQDCPEVIEDEEGNDRIIINEDGIDIDIKDNGDSFKMKIDGNGVKIQADDDTDGEVLNIDLNDQGEGLKMNIDEDGVIIKNENS
ncbi:PspC domain-containing protein [Maribacter sp. ANRC-HE7]|uniref:PspC domain-containing protein n=1 Tax=Maribacter aquimaris TaxID=2737171 RepID=A0ABR7UYL1_9FLAO|nr:PspC domain-containing protein [Maribacter aquimaris]MBD0776719.1 PspC domain-containing protein [Maribacter aquimaris]